MTRTFAYTTLLVDDIDRALAFFTVALRFEVIEDTVLTATRRWVVVAPSRSGGALLLALANTPAQQALIAGGDGGQGGGRVWLFMHTDDFDGEVAHMAAHGVRFTEQPRRERYGTVVVFLDLWGNRWDLIQPIAEADR